MMECVICHELLSDNTSEILECKHEFHMSCISKWMLFGGGNCPICRQIPNQMTHINIRRKAILSASITYNLPHHLIGAVLMVYECDKNGYLQEIIERYSQVMNILNNKVFINNLKRSTEVMSKCRNDIASSTPSNMRIIFNWLGTDLCSQMSNVKFDEAFEKMIKI